MNLEHQFEITTSHKNPKSYGNSKSKNAKPYSKKLWKIVEQPANPKNPRKPHPKKKSKR